MTNVHEEAEEVKRENIEHACKNLPGAMKTAHVVE